MNIEEPRGGIGRSLAERVNPERTALLVIDMSNDLVHEEGKTAQRAGRPIEHAQSIIPSINALCASARLVGAPVVFIQHTTLTGGASSSGPWLDARSRASYSVADLCVEGTWGQQIIDELRPKPDDLVIKKFRYGGFGGTSLDLILRSRGCDTVICCGASTNVCVEATAREAFALDYYVVMVSDACASWDMTLHEASLDTARHRYASVCSRQELVGVWSSGASNSPSRLPEPQNEEE